MPGRRKPVGFYTRETRRGEKVVSPIFPPKGRIRQQVTVRRRVKKRSRKSWASYASAAQVMELSRFLAGYISGRDVEIQMVDNPLFRGFSTDLKTIYAPDWADYNLPVDGFDEWRIYRHGIWHEANHIKYTPQQLLERARNSPEYIRLLINVLEDKRIEDLGVKYHPGALPERLYHQAYGYALRPSVEAYSWCPPAQLCEAFLQKLLTGKIKGDMDPELRDRVERAAAYAERRIKKLEKENLRGEELANRIAGLAEEVADLLKLRDEARKMAYGEVKPPSKPPKGLSKRDRERAKRDIKKYKEQGDLPDVEDWDETFRPPTKDELPKPTKSRVEKDIKEYFKELEREARKKGRIKRPDGDVKPDEIYVDDVEKAKTGSADVKAEYEAITGGGRGVEDPALTGFMPVTGSSSAAKYEDPKFKRKMAERLREWRRGFRAAPSKTGASFNVDAWLYTEGKRPFVSVKRRSVRGGKYLFVVDFSGSIRPYEEEYKKALINALEALQGIGAQIAVFGFGGLKVGRSSYSGLFTLKRFEEGPWRRGHSSRLAGGVEADGGTPMAKAYKRLEAYINRHRPEYVITVTDGAPDNIGLTKEMIEKLGRKTEMVAFGIANEESTAKMMRWNLKSLGYRRSFVVTDLDRLPGKLVDLIAPRET